MPEFFEPIAPYFVIGILLVTFVLIYRNVTLPITGMFLAVLVFLFTGIIKVNDVLEGLSNPAIATIMLLIIIASLLNTHFNLSGFFDRLIVHSKGYKRFLASMMFATSVLSSFMNNTAVVALMSKYVHTWGAENDVSPSKLMMPLSFAAIVGGMTTIIGTSTTLILIGFMDDYNAGQLNWMYLLGLGAILTLLAIGYFISFGHKLLPDKKDLIRSLKENPREYLAEMMVTEESPLVGASLESGKMHNLNDFYLVEIIRDDQIISPVPPETVIQARDRLFFAGDTKKTKSLMKLKADMVIPGSKEEEESRLDITEVVISYNSSIVGRSIKHSGFRQRYDAAVLAVHRNGEKLRGKLGNITLRAGDVLLLSTGLDFREKVDVYKDLYVISSTRAPRNIPPHQRWSFIILSAIALTLLITQVLSLITSLLIIFGAMVLLRLVNLRGLKRELDINLGGILVLSLAMGKAIIASGASHLIAEWIVLISQNTGPYFILAIIILLTALLTSFITNVAAVSIAFPIAYDLSLTYTDLGTSLFLGIAFAASAAFLTPISYQTNLIVSGPGGYKFNDFAKAGFPLFILYLAALFAMLFFV